MHSVILNIASIRWCRFKISCLLWYCPCVNERYVLIPLSLTVSISNLLYCLETIYYKCLLFNCGYTVLLIMCILIELALISTVSSCRFSYYISHDYVCRLVIVCNQELDPLLLIHKL